MPMTLQIVHKAYYRQAILLSLLPSISPPDPNNFPYQVDQVQVLLYPWGAVSVPFSLQNYPNKVITASWELAAPSLLSWTLPTTAPVAHPVPEDNPPVAQHRVPCPPPSCGYMWPETAVISSARCCVSHVGLSPAYPLAGLLQQWSE